MPMTSLRDLYIHQLKDLYSAEKQLTKALPKMVKAAGSDDLRQAFEEHLEVTRQQMERLEQILEELGQKLSAPKCKGMEGIIEENQELLKEDAEEAVLDAGLIAGAQKVEHYEIAGYGTARTYAEMLGEANAARLLEQTLQEEEETDRLLTELAMNINVEAERGEDIDDERESGRRASGAGGGRSSGRSGGAQRGGSSRGRSTGGSNRATARSGRR